MLKNQQWYIDHRKCIAGLWEHVKDRIPWEIAVQVDNRIKRHDLDKLKWSGLGIGSDTEHEIKNDHHLAYYRVNHVNEICDAAVIEMILDWESGFIGKGYRFNARGAFEYKYKERMPDEWYEQFYYWLEVMGL